MNRAQECNMFGQFTVTGNSYSGSFVSFSADNGSLRDYSVGLSKSALFTKVSAEPFGLQSSGTSGAVAQVNGSSGRFMVHNNAASMLHFMKTGQGNVTLNFQLSPGLAATPAGNGSCLRIGAGPEAVLVYSDGEATTKGSLVTIIFAGASGSATVRVSPSTVQGMRLQVQQLMQEGAMGGEMDVVVSGGAHAEDSQGFSHSTNMAVRSAGTGKISLTVKAEYSEGKLFRVGMDRTTAGTGSAGELRVMLDGKAMKKVGAGELARLRTERSGEAACAVEFQNMECNVMAYIPHFSEHVLTIEKVDSQQPSSLPGFEAAAFLLAASACLMAASARRR